jgi:hypothetical protein
MKFSKVIVLASLVSLSTTLAAGPGVGGGGSNVILVKANYVSDVRLKNENIVRFEELLQNKDQFKIKPLSQNLYKIDLNQSEIADIQLIDGSIVGGDMGGGSIQ